MKKIFLVLIAFLFLIPIVNASPGRLVNSSITTCNGITYGYHSSDKHWHVAVQNSDGSYNASGDIIGYSSPCQSVSTYNPNDSQTTTSSNEQVATSTDEQTSIDEQSATDEDKSANEQTTTDDEEKTDDEAITSINEQTTSSTDEQIETSSNQETDDDETNGSVIFILLFPITILDYFYFKKRTTKFSIINKINSKNFKNKLIRILIYFIYFILILPTLYDLIALIIDQTISPSKKLFK